MGEGKISPLRPTIPLRRGDGGRKASFTRNAVAGCTTSISRVTVPYTDFLFLEDLKRSSNGKLMLKSFCYAFTKWGAYFQPPNMIRCLHDLERRRGFSDDYFWRPLARRRVERRIENFDGRSTKSVDRVANSNGVCSGARKHGPPEHRNHPSCRRRPSNAGLFAGVYRGSYDWSADTYPQKKRIG